MAKRKQQEAAKEVDRLEARLSDYSAVARVSAAAKSGHRRFGNWPIYAAATGSALAMATSASANIIDTGIVSGSFQSVSVNPVGPFTDLGLHMGGPTVKIDAVAPGTFVILGLNPGADVNIFNSGGTSLAKNFAFGASIEGAAVASGHIVKAAFTGNLYGNFVSGQPGFAGFSFVNGGNTEYGWVELEFTDKAGLPFNLEALAFGVDTNTGQTPGTLAAGQIDGGFIPEPGTMSLALLACGAAGVMALRRRRQQQAAPTA